MYLLTHILATLLLVIGPSFTLSAQGRTLHRRQILTSNVGPRTKHAINSNNFITVDP